MERKTAKVRTRGKISKPTLVSGTMTPDADTVFTSGQAEVNMMANGQPERCMGMENDPGLMDEATLVKCLPTKSMAKASTLGRIETRTMENGSVV